MKVLNGSAYREPTFIRKKYELTDESIVYNGRILKRIRALVNFGYIRAGTLGGFVESVGNLSQEGYCWIYSNARVYDNAFIYGNIQVDGASDISGNAQLMGYGNITDRTVIRGNVKAYGEIQLSGMTVLKDNVVLNGRNEIKNASVKDNVILAGNNRILGHMLIGGYAQLFNVDLKQGE